MTAPLIPGDRVELTEAGRRLYRRTPERRGYVFRDPHNDLVTVKWDRVITRATIHVNFVQRIEANP